MPFDAIVHAPVLRVGVRLNIAEADQKEGIRPARLGVGAEVRLRFGVCCPERSNGRIVAFARQQPDVAVLAVGRETWTLRRGDDGGVSTPGLVSEFWYATGSREQGASPIDHSVTHSSKAAAAEVDARSR